VIGHTEAAFLITSTVISSITQTALCVCGRSQLLQWG
jgi:hypothetical protein